MKAIGQLSGIDTFFNAQVLGSFLLMRVLETERRAGNDDTRILVQVDITGRVR